MCSSDLHKDKLGHDAMMKDRDIENNQMQKGLDLQHAMQVKNLDLGHAAKMKGLDLQHAMSTKNMDLDHQREQAAMPQSAEALQWARNNPSDPRSAEILKRLGVK